MRAALAAWGVGGASQKLLVLGQEGLGGASQQLPVLGQEGSEAQAPAAASTGRAAPSARLAAAWIARGAKAQTKLSPLELACIYTVLLLGSSAHAEY